MATIHRTVSVGSLSSITSTTSDGSITKKKKTKPTSVTVGFKYHWFETTLNFIKDDRRLSLNYGVTPAQAIFIRDVLNFEANPSLKLEKYAPLYEALKIFGLKYNFKLRMIKKHVLVFQKIPKPRKQFLEPNSTTKPLTPQKEREKKVIDRISRDYMVEKAQTILDFIDDPTRATLEFTKVKPLESMFLQTVMTAARPLFPEHGPMLERVRNIKPTLDFSLQVMVGKINKKTNERSVIFKKDPKFSKKGKSNRENSLTRSNISLNNNFVPSTKEQPKISAQNTHNKENSTQKLNSMDVENNKQNSMQIAQKAFLNSLNSIQNVQNTMQNLQNSVQNLQNSMQSVQNQMHVQNSMQSEQTSMQVEQNSIQSKQNSMQVEHNSQEPMDVDSPRSIGSMNSCSAISVQSEPVRGVDRTRSASAMGERIGSEKPLGSVTYGSQNNLNLPSSTTNKQHISRRDVSGLNPRKAKLLEAMSMPVQLDKPARMMQKMGWNGGPLGIRGIGITEPIIPALDLVSGAGFGHVKPAKPEVAQKCFRQELLETILDLVQTEKVTVSLAYPNMMSRKEINFVRHTVTSFSERQKITLKNVEEARVAKLVIDALKKLPNVVIHGAASECKKQITLKKVIIVRPQANLPLLPQPGVIKVEHLNKLADAVEGYRYAYKKPKQKKFLGTRITILIEILHFLQFNEQFKELVFESMLSTQEKVYIVKAVQSINRRCKPPMCHAMTLEDDICNDILGVIGDCVLTVKIDQNKSAVLFEKAVAMEMKTYKNSLMNELRSINVVNNVAVQNINVINGNIPNDSAMADFTKNIPSNISAQVTTNKSTIKVKNSNNIVVPINYISNKTIAKNHDTVENSNKSAGLSKNLTMNGTNNKKDSEYINKILEKRLQNLDKPKSYKDSNDNNVKLQSEDDDVILIETLQEIIVISDDESADTSTENAQITDRSVKIDEVLEKQGLEIKISNVEGNENITVQSDLQETQKVTDSNITQCNADMNISNSQGSGKIDMTPDRADMTISNHQDSTAALDISSIEANVENDTTKEHEYASIPNSRNNIVCDISNIQENGQIAITKECADISIPNTQNNTDSDISNVLENAKTDTATESADKYLSNLEDSTKLDMSNIQENAKIDTVKESANISTLSVDNSTLDIPIIDGIDGAETEKTDINKVIVKIEPKREKLSYSEEFDKDLHDLEEVLLLDDDDDVFDYTIVKKEKDDSIDKIERPSSKRSRSDSVESSPDNSKKTKIFTFKNSKNLLLVPKDYPDVEITKECTIKIQTILSDAIEKCKELPLLKCHGIQDGGLVYSCHNEQSLFFVENSLSIASDYKIISDVVIKKKPYKMRIRFNSLLDDIKTLFSRLELYNAGLITDCWWVKETQKYEDYIVISVEIEEYSYKYICDNRFSLYAGIDEAKFSVVWD